MDPLIGEYIEDGYRPNPTLLQDDVYGSVLDNIVLACVDIIFTHKGKILLGKRTRHPQADWWLVGGRMRTGETMGASAHRLTKTELDIGVDPSRFTYLTTFAAAWNKRAFPPENNGTHTLSVVLTTSLTDSEVAGIVPNDEYSAIDWVDAELLAKDTVNYHSALRQCAITLRS